jgi:DNA-binding Lrp family transcriptional regulator
MVIKLDLKDKKLLYELDFNARQSLSQIARKIGLSPEVVNYRIRRLEKEKIITQYQLIINLSKINILQFKICLSFQHMNPEKLIQIVEKLKQKQEVKWIVSCKGNWDLIIALETDSIEGIDKLKSEVLELFQSYIIQKTISILVEAETYNRSYFLPTHSIHKSRIIMKKETPIKLDELDLKILKSLGENARKPIIDIAKEVKLTVRVVNYRIKQMINKKIILGFKIAINYEKLGIKFFKTFIYLDNPKTERVKSFLNTLAAHKNIVHNVKVLGNWEFEPEFEVFSEEEFDKIIYDLKDEYSDIIKKIEIITISKEHKFVYF